MIATVTNVTAPPKRICRQSAACLIASSGSGGLAGVPVELEAFPAEPDRELAGRRPHEFHPLLGVVASS